MYTVFNFDEYWDQFFNFPDPEFFDPIVDLLYPETSEVYLYMEDSSLDSEHLFSLEQLSLF